jgi:hypothetical protein
MTFREYMRKLRRLEKRHPEIMNMDVIYRKDEYRPVFTSVIRGASIGVLYDGVYFTMGSLTSNSYTKKDINAVCIN